MKKVKIVRARWLTIRLNEEEYTVIEDFYKATTGNTLSEYARDILLRKPVIVTYRNASADAFLDEFIHLKNELNTIGNNFNQAVRKLHTLDNLPEIRPWVILNETEKQSLFQKIEQIKLLMNQLHEQWLQK